MKACGLKWKVLIGLLFPFYCSEYKCQAQTIWNALESENNKVLVAAHRGDSKNYPENSIPAIQSCIDRGIDIVEVDVQRTRDGHFVLMHDQTVRRTTNGKGKVSRYLLKDIVKLRLKDKHKQLTEHTVPTLDSVLKTIRGKIIVNLDKSSGMFEELLALIKKYDCGPYVILKGSGGAGYYRELKANDQTGTLFMPVKHGKMKNIDTFALEANASLMEVLIRRDTDYVCRPEVLQSLRSKKCYLWYNALFDAISASHTESRNALMSWQWFINHDAKVIQTDYPFQLMQFLIENNLHQAPQGHLDVSLENLPERTIDLQNLGSKDFILSKKTNSKIIKGDKKNRNDSIPSLKKKIIAKSKKYHRVKSGESLHSIAAQYGITAEKLKKMNPSLRNKKGIRVGIKLRVS